MGAAASIQTTVNTLSEKISNKLEQTAEATASTNCDIEIGNIIFRQNKGCNVTVKNLCSSKADAQLDAVVKAAAETFETLTPEQKAYVPSLFTAALNIQTSVNTVVKDFETYVKQKCKSDSVIKNKLKVQNILIDECASPPGTTTNFEFINSGTSQGICAIKTLMDVTTKASTNISPKQSTGFGYQYYIIAAVVVILALLFVYYTKRMFFMSTQDKIKVILASKPDVHWTSYIDTFFSHVPTVVDVSRQN
ncbi:Myristylated IMV envelope protein [Eptesipox virus]|uniref:Myristylated IMV envelope protein n=1 Tax=Eptesipox virus TaxID=1329402 RepID=A0A220T6C8_9POXV|nr:Myristylated IMV envelope protein [Eptesipox virus]ASK51265.1 Myristylated IMV envelope protein [Eptesipox virus]WAH71023.1 myristylated IMV envelope protein [Eptesipox virus]